MNRVGAPQNTAWMVSNIIFSPIDMYNQEKTAKYSNEIQREKVHLLDEAKMKLIHLKSIV